MRRPSRFVAAVGSSSPTSPPRSQRCSWHMAAGEWKEGETAKRRVKLSSTNIEIRGEGRARQCDCRRCAGPLVRCPWAVSLLFPSTVKEVAMSGKMHGAFSRTRLVCRCFARGPTRTRRDNKYATCQTQSRFGMCATPRSFLVLQRSCWRLRVGQRACWTLRVGGACATSSLLKQSAHSRFTVASQSLHSHFTVTSQSLHSHFMRNPSEFARF